MTRQSVDDIRLRLARLEEQVNYAIRDRELQRAATLAEHADTLRWALGLSTRTVRGTATYHHAAAILQEAITECITDSKMDVGDLDAEVLAYRIALRFHNFNIQIHTDLDV